MVERGGRGCQERGDPEEVEFLGEIEDRQELAQENIEEKKPLSEVRR